MTPSTITFMVAREMRTRAMINMPTGTLVSIIPGQTLEGVEVIADSIERAFELWVRIRAHMMTLSYVSILKPDWFPYQAAVVVSEHMLVFVTDTYRGYSPDVDFLIGAWGATSLYFTEETRVQKKDPKKSLLTSASGSTNGHGCQPHTHRGPARCTSCRQTDAAATRARQPAVAKQAGLN